jgi:hypothetical protein
MAPNAHGSCRCSSLFQQILVTVVLAGLVMVIVELYLDDLIIPASTEDELIDNFITVLKRFRKYNITTNPETKWECQKPHMWDTNKCIRHAL